jgi:hypothetical protein
MPTLIKTIAELLAVRIEAAIASGTYDIGLETLIAESLTVTERRILHTHERTGAATSLLTIRREDKNEPTSLEAVLALAKSSGSPFLVNASSGRAASASATSSREGTKWQGAAITGFPLTPYMGNAVCCAWNACHDVQRRGLAVKPVGKPDAVVRQAVDLIC